GLYLPHLRQRQVALTLSNSAGYGLTAFGAASAVLVLSGPVSAHWAITAVLVLVAISLDWLINSVVVGVASGVRASDPVLPSVREQLSSDTDVLALTFSVGALTAANGGRSLAVAVLAIGVALVAFEIKLARRRQGKTGKSRDRIPNTALIATTAVVVCAHPA